VEALLSIRWQGLARLMNVDRIGWDSSLESLLDAGKRALSAGNRRAAHEYWRMAAVSHPYEERVWLALMDVITEEDDREVCLENIIAINPLNPDARRQLRALRSAQPPEPAATPDPTPEPAVQPPAQAAKIIKPLAETRESKRVKRSLTASIVVGIGVGVLAVVLGVVFSILLYGGLVSLITP
jgi:hypothetical protein